MNGRVYDYNLGRFMSVDPFIFHVGSTQAVNPYSYIMNNPLAGTDPTGYIAFIPAIMWAINAYAAYETANAASDAYDSYQNGDISGADVATAVGVSALENTIGKKVKLAKEGVQKVRQAFRGDKPNTNVQNSTNASNTDGGTKTSNGADNTQGANNASQKTTDIGSPSQISKKEQLTQNKAQGKAGEAQVREELGDANRGEQVTIETLNGDRARVDFVTTKDGKPHLVEVKTGNAKLSKGQKAVQKAIDNKEPVIPRGANAEAADLEPGVATVCSFEEKRC